MDDCFLTIKNPAEIELKIKNSRFIGRTFLVENEKDAQNKLDEIRKKEYTANHHCYAYIIKKNNDQVSFKYSDDGEPNGTAGKPIYDVIKGSSLVNLLLVVTRYFGGTKLGTGGLVKAYSESAKLLLDKSGIKENYITQKYKVEIEFALYDLMLNLINKLGATKTESDFSEKVVIQLEIRQSKAEQLENEIIELSKGKAIIEKIS